MEEFAEEYIEDNEQIEEEEYENQEEQELPVAPKYPCRWAECDAGEFSSELDMGLHVLANHLIVLQHGHYTLTRGLHGSAAPQTPVAPVAPVVLEAPVALEAPETPETPVTPATPETPRNSMTPINVRKRKSEGPVKMSDVAVKLIRRLMAPSREGRLFQSEHFCLICQRNFTSPCTENHNPKEMEVVEDWKSTYGHLEPKKKKAMLMQMRKLRDKYLRAESVNRLIVKNETLPDEKPLWEVMAADETFRSTRRTMSTLCTSLISRIEARGAEFQSEEGAEFCLNCLSFGNCQRVHNERERRLENTWKKYYDQNNVTVDRLVHQLEILRGRYMEAEWSN